MNLLKHPSCFLNECLNVFLVLSCSALLLQCWHIDIGSKVALLGWHCSYCGLMLGCSISGLVAAATPPGSKSSGIICWSDSNGRQVGCGYTVPPEFANNPTRELNARGITVKKSDATLGGEALRLKQQR